MHLVNYPEASLVGYLYTVNINRIFKNRKSCCQKITGILVNYPEASLVAYLHTFNINWIFKTVEFADTQAQAFKRITQGLP